MDVTELVYASGAPVAGAVAVHLVHASGSPSSATSPLSHARVVAVLSGGAACRAFFKE